MTFTVFYGFEKDLQNFLACGVISTKTSVISSNRNLDRTVISNINFSVPVFVNNY